MRFESAASVRSSSSSGAVHIGLAALFLLPCACMDGSDGAEAADAVSERDAGSQDTVADSYDTGEMPGDSSAADGGDCGQDGAEGCTSPPARPCEEVQSEAGDDCPGGADCPDSEGGPSPVKSHILDQRSGARAAYSLRRLREGYSGPAVRVRRSSDDEERDVSYTEDGWVDARAVEDFVGDGDGFITKWYAQVEGTPNLKQSDPSRQPRLARDGTVERDAEGNYTVRFERGNYLESGEFDEAISLTNYTMWGVVDPTNYEGETEVFGIGTLGQKHWQTASYRFSQSYINHNGARFGDQDGSIVFEQFNTIMMRNDGQRAEIWQGNTRHAVKKGDGIGEDRSKSKVSIGGGFQGAIGEFVTYPSRDRQGLLDFYRSVATDWGVGPAEWNEDAMLPQQYEYQVTLYDWLESLTVEDVTLPEGEMKWDREAVDDDQLADLWLQAEGLTASSVTRGEPEWYVLDAGNGKGIEATDAVRFWNEPKGSGGYGGNPPRAWANEPAFYYQLDLPTSDGSQGNPYYGDPAVARRALVVAMVDLMMHHRDWETSASGWYDMFGKAALSWAETYRWTKSELPPDVREAFETGMGHALDRMIAIGPRAVNTNMDMFAVQAQADFAMATDDPVLECKAVRAARRALFGKKDGALEDDHEVFAVGGRDGGVFDPSGFIMEGGQPDVFYAGESIYHLAGALAAVTDRETGEMPPEWTFLEEVVRRLQAWRSYQMFYDPVAYSPAVGGNIVEKTIVTAGGGFNGRTSYGVPAGQASEPWKHQLIGSRFPEHAFKGSAPNPGEMEETIDSKLEAMNGELSENYTDTPPEWGGWSPWAKKTTYLPREGWYSDLKQMYDDEDPRTQNPPPARADETFNKTFGGEPVGQQYWAFKDQQGDEAWGFFLEAQARQGTYGGWYGGKIETFWTESTGVVLINRHGKSGCDDNNEDSTCWDNLDKKAGHHVWGRDENGNGFTTLMLRGRQLERTSTFETEGSNPSVTVNNVFNDPSQSEGTGGKSGEKTGSELEGDVEVENQFEVRDGGLQVTHTVTSDESDEINALWASLPVYLKHNNPKRAGDNLQKSLEDTSIEYRTGGAWEQLPEDEDGDGRPELVSTDSLRLGRNFERGNGMQYVYVVFDAEQQVRLSTGKYYDPYQSKTGVRTVHVDLHGNPGDTATMPSETSVSYTLRPNQP